MAALDTPLNAVEKVDLEGDVRTLWHLEVDFFPAENWDVAGSTGIW
jgi:hypothetical protein